MSVAEMLAQFESLGQDCEFAFLQKAFGIHFPGLFRWGTISVPQLTLALKGGLAGIGQPDTLRMRWDHDEKEYFCDEDCYGFSYHTFEKNREIDLEVLRERESKRLVLLARVLLENLRETRKIYVRKSREPTDDAETLALHQALCVYGSNTLIVVEPTRDPHLSGRVVRVAPGLLRARVVRVAVPGYASFITTQDVWLSICTSATRLLSQTLDAERPSVAFAS